MASEQDLYDQFISTKSKDISIDLMKSANALIDRRKITMKIDKILKDVEKSMALEMGIYEFALVYLINNNIDISLIKSIYIDCYENIMACIDSKSPTFNSQLIKNISSNVINPQHVAFLTPEQKNPEQYADIINKKRYEEKMNLAHQNVSTIYVCRKCGGNKCSITQLQTRCADEPMTIFISCMICYFTFKK